MRCARHSKDSASIANSAWSTNPAPRCHSIIKWNKLGVPHANLDATINQVLNLNCERLRVARQKILDNIRTWYVLILQELSTDTHLSSEEQRQLLALWVAGRLKPDARGYLRAFWSTERDALGPPAEDWVLANSGLFE